MKQVDFRLYIEATPEAVWEALTDPGQIAQWSYMEGPVELDQFEPGGTYLFRDQSSDDRAKILDVEPGGLFRYRWHSSEPEPTVMEYRLQPAANGSHTLLHVINSGYGSGEQWDHHYESTFRGWVEIHLRLKQILEGHEGRKFLTGASSTQAG